jgi:hypothetical protein
MNKVEKAWSEELTANPNVADWWFEPFTLRISHPEDGQPAKYTPDFLVLMADGLTYVDDVKPPGNFDDNASIVRIKSCAELFPLWVFRIVKKKLKRDCKPGESVFNLKTV